MYLLCAGTDEWQTYFNITNFDASEFDGMYLENVDLRADDWSGLGYACAVPEVPAGGPLGRPNGELKAHDVPHGGPPGIPQGELQSAQGGDHAQDQPPPGVPRGLPLEVPLGRPQGEIQSAHGSPDGGNPDGFEGWVEGFEGWVDEILTGLTERTGTVPGVNEGMPEGEVSEGAPPA